jgi:hypothetical protein
VQVSELWEDIIRLDTRLAGQVQRYHTWPTIRKQTIAEHTWQILRIYSCVDELNVNTALAIIYHDIGEHYTGDIPYPVKAQNPELKKEMDVLELQSWAAQLTAWEVPHIHALDIADKKFFKLVEIIEMAEFGLDEVCLGNSHGLLIADRCLRHVYKNIAFPACGKEARLVTYIVRRLNLFMQQCMNRIVRDGPWWYTNHWEDKREKAESDSKNRAKENRGRKTD